MKLNLNSQQILPIVFVSGLLIFSLTSNSFLTSAFGQQERQFSAKLMGNNEVPPVNTQATGIANFTLSPDGKSLQYTLIAHDITGAHLAEIYFIKKDADTFNDKMNQSFAAI